MFGTAFLCRVSQWSPKCRGGRCSERRVSSRLSTAGEVPLQILAEYSVWRTELRAGADCWRCCEGECGVRNGISLQSVAVVSKVSRWALQ